MNFSLTYSNTWNHTKDILKWNRNFCRSENINKQIWFTMYEHIILWENEIAETIQILVELLDVKILQKEKDNKFFGDLITAIEILFSVSIR